MKKIKKQTPNSSAQNNSAKIIDLTMSEESSDQGSEREDILFMPVKRKFADKEQTKSEKLVKKMKKNPDDGIFSCEVNQHFFELVQSKQNLRIAKPNFKITTYDTSKEKDISRLEKDQQKRNPNYIYDRNFNRSITKIKLFIAPVYAIEDKTSNLGVFAKSPIKAGEEIIAHYAGKHIKNDEDENENSKAVFQLIDRKGEITETIDGEINGDWTAFINGGVNANVSVRQEIIDEQVVICLRVTADVGQYQELIMNYGTQYKQKLGKKFIFLHPDDDWRSPEEIYLDKKIHLFYADQVHYFDEKICKEMNINPATGWLCPKIFRHIFLNDIKSLTEILDQGCPPDLLAYAVDAKSFRPTSEQQHLTGLHLASFLGYKDCVDILLKYGADADRCMLINGLNSIALLLKGPAANATIDEIGLMLLKNMYYPFETDKDELNLLHYAIKRNSATIVNELILIAREEKHDFFSQMYDRPKTSLEHADVDYCITHGQYNILKILLLDMLNRKILAQHFNSLLVFKEATLSSLPKDQLKNFHSFLNNDFDFQAQKIYLIEAIKKYVLVLLGTRSYVSEKISPSLEIDYLWRFISHSKNEENINLFLNNIDPHYYFEKCITPKRGIDIATQSSPLEFALQLQPEIATKILKHMQQYLESCDKKTSYNLLFQFDRYSCIKLALEKNTYDVYDGIMSLSNNYDPQGNLFTLLLTQLIENYQNLEFSSKMLQTITNDASKVYKLSLTAGQRTFVLLSVVNFCKVNFERLNNLFIDIKFMIDCIYHNFPTQKTLDYNLPLMQALENNFPLIFLHFFAHEGSINGADMQGLTPLHIAISNNNEEQVRFLLVKNAKINQSILQYARINSAQKIVKVLEEHYLALQKSRYSFLTSMNTQIPKIIDLTDCKPSQNEENRSSLLNLQ